MSVKLVLGNLHFQCVGQKRRSPLYVAGLNHCWWSAVIVGFPDWRKTRGGSPVLSPRQVVIRVTVPLSLPTMTHLTVSILLLDLPPSLYHTVVTSHQGNILVSLAISNYRFYRLLGSLAVSSGVLH